MLVPIISHKEKSLKDNNFSPQPTHNQSMLSDVLVLSLPYVHMDRTTHLNISTLVLLLPLSSK